MMPIPGHISLITNERGQLVAQGRGGIRVTSIQRTNGVSFRLRTLAAVYPRFIHSEVMTHRALSKNAASSRAIPVAKLVEQVRESPAMPIHWGANQPGMQAKAELTGMNLELAQDAWRLAAVSAAAIADGMSAAGAHKQIANRVLEPFMFMHTLISGTEWDGLYELRCHEDAQPEFQELANCIRALDAAEVPRPFDAGSDAYKHRIYHGQNLMPGLESDDNRYWHLPYVTREERASLPITVLLAISVARCARVSYLTHEGTTPSVQKDVDLFLRLVGSKPLHASPTEHQALFTQNVYDSRNFRGPVQFRELLEAHHGFFVNSLNEDLEDLRLQAA